MYDDCKNFHHFFTCYPLTFFFQTFAYQYPRTAAIFMTAQPPTISMAKAVIRSLAVSDAMIIIYVFQLYKVLRFFDIFDLFSLFIKTPRCLIKYRFARYCQKITYFKNIKIFSLHFLYSTFNPFIFGHTKDPARILKEYNLDTKGYNYILNLSNLDTCPKINVN